MTNTRCCCYVCCGSHEGCYSSSYSWRIWMRNEVCSLILRCCFCCSWQSSLFLLSVVALVEEKERRILGKTSYLFSRLRVFASRFFVFLSTTRGRNVSSLRRRRFFFFEGTERRRQLRFSSRATTWCLLRLSQFFFTFFIAFLARVHSVWCLLKDGFLFVGQTMSFIVHVLVHIFSLLREIIYSFPREKSRVISALGGTKKKYHHHQSFYHHPIHDDGIKTQKVLHVSLSSLLFASRYKRTHECSSNSVTNQSKANDRDVDCYDAIESIHSVRVHVLISQRY